MSRADFRPFVPEPGEVAAVTARAHAEARLQLPRPRQLFAEWTELAAAPFRGLTTDGQCLPGLFSLQPEDAPVEAMVDAAHSLLQRLDSTQRARTCFPVDSELWRRWQNTELYVERHGLRLEEVALPLREAVMALARASLSGRGYQSARDVMRLNGFLGELVGAPAVLNEWSYIFCLFGEPSRREPWGWQLFGHHLSLNCLVIGHQMVLSPIFLGAEPAYADVGPLAGTQLFQDQEHCGLTLMRSLSAAQQRRAIVAHSMMDGDLPPGRRHFADQLHLGGAYQDNRIVPYEGLAATTLSAVQQRDLLELIGRYIEPLPAGPRAARLRQIERHLADTHFCWIGGLEDSSAFYYRVQSPVIFIEFDQHAGVFLTNQVPAKFHVHTIVRTPNGNDYGIDLLRLHYQQASHHQSHTHTG